MRIRCWLDYDEASETVTLTHAKTRTQVMKIKLESCAASTMSRVPTDGSSDADNFWMGVKPSDSTVFNDKLFYPRHSLQVSEIKFNIIKK